MTTSSSAPSTNSEPIDTRSTTPSTSSPTSEEESTKDRELVTRLGERFANLANIALDRYETLMSADTSHWDKMDAIRHRAQLATAKEAAKSAQGMIGVMCKHGFMRPPKTGGKKQEA